MLFGNKVELREITLEDTNNIIRWRNNIKVKKNFCVQEDFTIERHTNWYNTYILSGKAIQFIIVDKDNNKDVGSVYLRDIDYKNKKAEFGIFIGDDLCRGKGLGTECAEIIIQYAFEKLKIHKVFLRVFEDNVNAIKSYQNAGFNVEGNFKDDICVNENEYRNMVFMGIINSERKIQL
ncbi:MAG: GNAT family protein [Clostridia bacterium]